MLTHSHQLAGRWKKGLSAGGSRNSSSYSSNPKFWLRVCERGEVVVSLLQHKKWRNAEKTPQAPLEENKNTKHQHYQAIALHMWKVGVTCETLNICVCIVLLTLFSFQVERKRFNLSRLLNKPPCASTQCHAYDGEVVVREELEPGYYLMIPSTYQPGAEGHFLIRVFSSFSISLR